MNTDTLKIMAAKLCTCRPRRPDSQLASKRHRPDCPFRPIAETNEHVILLDGILRGLVCEEIEWLKTQYHVSGARRYYQILVKAAHAVNGGNHATHG